MFVVSSEPVSVQVEEVGFIPGQGGQSSTAAGLLLHSPAGPLPLQTTATDGSVREGTYMYCMESNVYNHHYLTHIQCIHVA